MAKVLKGLFYMMYRYHFHIKNWMYDQASACLRNENYWNFKYRKLKIKDDLAESERIKNRAIRKYNEWPGV